jgi:hypothetical protein
MVFILFSGIVRFEINIFLTYHIEFFIALKKLKEQHERIREIERMKIWNLHLPGRWTSRCGCKIATVESFYVKVTNGCH